MKKILLAFSLLLILICTGAARDRSPLIELQSIIPTPPPVSEPIVKENIHYVMFLDPIEAPGQYMKLVFDLNKATADDTFILYICSLI